MDHWTDPLVSTADLAELLAAGEVTLLDVRWRLGGPPARQDYYAGHLPGAAFLDLDTDLAAPPGEGGRHPLPSAPQLQRVLRAAGVRADRPVVAYDDADGSVAARAWWLLRWAGHDRAAVLDGGHTAWVADGRPVTADLPSPQPGDLEVRPGGMPVIGAAEAATLAREGTLVDARAAQRYRGEVEPVDPRAGHIPGARNTPFSAHLGADGRWRPPGELARSFVDAGVSDQGGIGAYCGSGVTACSVVLALQVAGITTAEHPAALYVGSWSHWCVDPDRPVATGDLPG